MTKFFVDAAGKYLGGFDGAAPPGGAIEVPNPPKHGLMKRAGPVWVDTPESIAAKNAPAPVDSGKLADLLRAKGLITAAELAGLRS